jgi:hypothetical protein
LSVGLKSHDCPEATHATHPSPVGMYSLRADMEWNSSRQWDNPTDNGIIQQTME